MTEQAKAHLDSRRLEDLDGRGYEEYLLRLSDTEAVERSPFRQSLMALGWLGLTEVVYLPPETERDGATADERTKWVVIGHKEIPGSEPMVAPENGGELMVTATVLADGERRLEFAFGAGSEAEYDPDDLNNLVWNHLEAIHRSLNEGEAENLPTVEKCFKPEFL